MEESVKNRVIIALAILTAIFFVATIGSCGSAGRMKSYRDKEMANRLDFEEKATKCVQEKTALQERLKNATQSLESEKTDHQITKKALLQEQLVNESLKEEVAKVTKLKEQLEADLKESLAKSKSKK